MKIKTLIAALQKFDPEYEVKFMTCGGRESGFVARGVFQDGKKAVSLNCRTTHNWGVKAE